MDHVAFSPLECAVCSVFLRHMLVHFMVTHMGTVTFLTTQGSSAEIMCRFSLDTCVHWIVRPAWTMFHFFHSSGVLHRYYSDCVRFFRHIFWMVAYMSPVAFFSNQEPPLRVLQRLCSVFSRHMFVRAGLRGVFTPVPWWLCQSPRHTFILHRILRSAWAPVAISAHRSLSQMCRPFFRRLVVHSIVIVHPDLLVFCRCQSCSRLF